jgi:hypothetical protein
MIYEQDLKIQLNLISYFGNGLRYCLMLIFNDTFQGQVLRIIFNFNVQGKFLWLRMLFCLRFKEIEMFKFL